MFISILMFSISQTHTERYKLCAHRAIFGSACAPGGGPYGAGTKAYKMPHKNWSNLGIHMDPCLIRLMILGDMFYQPSVIGHGTWHSHSSVSVWENSTRLQHRSETCKQVHSAQLSEWLGMRRAVWKRGLQALKSNDKNIYLPMPLSAISAIPYQPLQCFPFLYLW